MPDLDIIPISYQNEDGTRTAVQFPTLKRRERFAQLFAIGDKAPWLCWSEAFDSPVTTDKERAHAAQMGGLMSRETDVLLRVQELRKPIVRKIQRKIEYNLQKALTMCQTAEALALANGDAKTLLKAVEMQSRLAKLLSEDINVNHRYGVLDDAATETLLEMRKEFEVRQGKRKQLLAVKVERVESVS